MKKLLILLVLLTMNENSFADTKSTFELFEAKEIQVYAQGSRKTDDGLIIETPWVFGVKQVNNGIYTFTEMLSEKSDADFICQIYLAKSWWTSYGNIVQPLSSQEILYVQGEVTKVAELSQYQLNDERQLVQIKKDGSMKLEKFNKRRKMITEVQCYGFSVNQEEVFNQFRDANKNDFVEEKRPGLLRLIMQE